MQRWDSEHAASSSRRARALIRGGVGGGDRGGGGGVDGGGRHDAPPLCVLRREPVRRVPRRGKLPVQREAAASGRRAVVEAEFLHLCRHHLERGERRRRRRRLPRRRGRDCLRAHLRRDLGLELGEQLLAQLLLQLRLELRLELLLELLLQGGQGRRRRRRHGADRVHRGIEKDAAVGAVPSLAVPAHAGQLDDGPHRDGLHPQRGLLRRANLDAEEPLLVLVREDLRGSESLAHSRR
mmetsp:Transcript_6974/g.20408  ORF Transcript_6974/g.20408 Transcript_6974/m.20408 type:complete len:238 (-) Transcript_6974:100-813(-)